MKKNNTQKMVTAALLAALTIIATIVIRIPTPGTNGYINIGDCIVLLSAWILGGWYGALAAGIGSALADLFAGYTIYAPGTFIIKFAMAFAAWLVISAFRKATSTSEAKRNKSHSFDSISHLVSGIVAELIMVAGYFLFESLFLGYGWAAAVSAISNGFQGMVNVVLGLALAAALAKTPIPHMILQENR